MDGTHDDPHGPVTPLLLCDPPRERFWPLAATRPVADLLAGVRTFRSRWAAIAGGIEALWCDEQVAGCAFRSGSPPQMNHWPPSGQGWRVAVTTWVPPEEWRFGDEPVEFRLGDRPVGWRLNEEQAREIVKGKRPGSPAELIDRIVELGLPERSVEGRHFDSIWGIMAWNPDLLCSDAAHFVGADTVTGVDPVVLLGEDLRVGPNVSIGPFAVLDSRDGPIVLDRDARIEPHSVCRGPLYVGPGSTILGGVVGDGTSIGPQCKVRGEVEQSIFQGYVNKAHDGFVGHSVIGEWVNLGASTTTSDLKNTYGPIRVDGPFGREETDLLKVGAFLGDHVRTGIGSLLTTGARMGVGTHFFGGLQVSPPWIPDFSWFDGKDRVPVKWDAFEKSTRVAMGRREQNLNDGERAILKSLHAGSVPDPDM